MRYLAALLLAATATPAVAQHHHHQAEVEAEAPPVDPHAHHGAGMDGPAMDGPDMDGHHMDGMQTHAPDHHAPAPSSPPPPAPADPHADHHGADNAPAGADVHAGHAMPSAHEGHTAHGHAPGIPDPPIRPPSAAALSGPAHAADRIFGTAAMAPAREVVRKEHGHITSGTILIDQLEATLGDGNDGLAWKAEGWHGGDIDRLWVKTEGEARFGESLEHVEVQALWSHALDPWWNLQAGVRQDFGTDPDRTYAVLGVKGLAPYWFEVDGALFVSHKGDVTARIEAEYDQRLTRKLILQPRAELNFAAQDVSELGLGSGLSTAALGLRLRYQFVPEFAPYIGVKYDRAFGDTARFRRAEGHDPDSWNVLIGIRSWF